jgi:TPR repeat protein
LPAIQTASVLKAEFTFDGQQIITASADRSVRLWDARYKLRFVFKDGSTGFSLFASASFSADGRRVVTGGLGDTLRVWDTQTGTVVSTLPSPVEHDQLVNPHFSPDGHIIYASGRGMTRWDSQGAVRLDALKSSMGPSYLGSLSPDGMLIIALSGQTASIFSVASREDIAEYGSVAALRVLTAERAQHFLPDDSKIEKVEQPGAPDANDCDRLAAHPFDPNKKAPGVEAGAITDQAADVCQAALLDNPGEPRFMFQLGRALAVTRKGDEKQAVAQYRRAAELGYAVAHNNLALLYQEGTAELPRNVQLAIEHYRAAWDLGMAVDSVNLGLIYLEGRLTPMDRKLGMDWLRKGAARGVPGAHLELARRYARAYESDFDLDQALYHYIVATHLYEAAHDDARAQSARRERASLARNMGAPSVVKVASKVSMFLHGKQ